MEQGLSIGQTIYRNCHGMPIRLELLRGNAVAPGVDLDTIRVELIVTMNMANRNQVILTFKRGDRQVHQPSHMLQITMMRWATRIVTMLGLIETNSID